jgi:hypothetical protein
MESVPGTAEAQLKRCDCCQRLAENLKIYSNETEREGDKPDRLCDHCVAVFWAADVLLSSETTDEAEIVSTLAFAARHGHRGGELLENLERKYPRFEMIRLVDSVPVLRIKPVLAEVIRYQSSTLVKQVRLRILSKFAEPERVANLYREALAQENLPVFQTSPGRISWEYTDAHLTVDVGPREEIESSRLEYFETYPQGYRFSFPLPSVVRAVSEALIGSPKRPGTEGDEMFASGLGDHGRPRTKEARTVIPACVAWFVGEHEASNKDTNSIVKDRRRRVSKMLNRHLLRPLKKPALADNPYSQNDPIWEDAKEVGPRFDRASAFLQKDEHDTFRRLLQ